ncbi:hypothetical protein [Pseudoflavonifractor sp. MSJ-37]|uniref:hypothetical protein n=1 Tax=Pseudoflavonifractor sp. MSJ-37 TaxID=2841531 RepID=UPI001C108F28|nr:hypothetical protein [Pseudoflavonifractor sp. MSJ-37]MBU5436124.1 hypothetical protein [Pseudoflavonifractor sp. MSJ-37]
MTDMIERRLPLLLAVSLAGNAVQWRAAHPDQPAPLRGTYTLGASTAAERLTFPTEGGWYRYQDGALLGRGTIHAQEDGVYFLQAETGTDAYLFRRGRHALSGPGRRPPGLPPPDQRSHLRQLRSE